MSHIHIPDGTLPLWIWLLALIIVILYLLGLGVFFKEDINYKKLPLVGVFAALMLISMSIEIIPLGYHINLAVLTGIFLGPLLSVLAIFIVNLVSALVGHGGITVIGLNTIVVSVEAIMGYYFFRLIHKKIKNLVTTGILTTILALFISTGLSICIVYFATGNLEYLSHHHDHDSVSNHEHHVDHHTTEEETHQHNSTQEIDIHQDENHEFTDQNSDLTSLKATDKTKKKVEFDIFRYAFLVLLLGSVGWLLEGIITGFIVSYIYKIKPELLEKMDQ